jgi:TPR repeat protein
VHYFKSAAVRGCGRTCAARGGGDRRCQDSVEAAEFYKIAADGSTGRPSLGAGQKADAAKYRFALMVQKGEWIAQKAAEATEYFKKAVDGGVR